jgi:hypothetical protein
VVLSFTAALGVLLWFLGREVRKLTSLAEPKDAA